MKITILTAGTRGDTQPFIALGLALEKRGHHITLVGMQNYADFVSAYGLKFHPIEGDVTQAMGSKEAQFAMQSDTPLKALLSFNKIKDLAGNMQGAYWQACQNAEAIIYHPGVGIGFFAGQKLGIPSVMASPFPMTPTKAYPSLVFYQMPRLGKWFNYKSHKIFERVLWMTSAALLKEFWLEEFGRLPNNFDSPYQYQVTKNYPTVIGCSDHVFPSDATWPAYVKQTGYWFLNEETAWQPPADLAAFLADGPAPIYFGFGSMGDPTQAAYTTDVVLDALERSGQRAVLARGWGGIEMLNDLSSNIHVLESAPHSWLFPRMAAVVHHGGAGTTAAGLRAGVPSLIVPFGIDQFAWAQRVFELGIGVKPIPRKKLSAKKLTEGIQGLLTSEIRLKAKAFGEKLQNENGADNAAEFIDNCLP